MCMTAPQTSKRFRINPVEVAIFSVVALIFMNSVYSLFYDRDNFQLATLTPMAASPTTENQSRSPASIVPTYANLDVRCGAMDEQSVTASKVRLTGQICTPAGTEEAKLIKTQITNGANKFNATVFTDVNGGKFSTDYIPLEVGKNALRIESSYPNGKLVTQELVIQKN